MFMRSGRKLDRSLTSLFKFDDNTAVVLERLVQEIHDNKELCSYQFINHPGFDDMLCGILKLIGNEDVRIAGNASYVVGSLAETALGCSRVIAMCSSSADESDVVSNLTSLLHVPDAETVLNAAGTLGTLAENEKGRLWLLRQACLDDTIDKLASILSSEDVWTASNAALVLARLAIPEEGCARILNHPHSTTILAQLIKSLQMDDSGAKMNAAFATGRLCDLQTGRVKLLQHEQSCSMLDSLMQMLENSDLGCRKNASFAISCLATSTDWHDRILSGKYNDRLFASILKMLSSSDEESVWFAAMTVRALACRREGILAVRRDTQIISALFDLSGKRMNGDTLNEINAALELLERLPKPTPPGIRVESAYVVSATWDKIYPKSGLDVVYELYRDNEIIYRGDADSFMMNDVKPISKYTFRLRTTTDGDESPFSDAVIVITPESVPGAPQSLFCLNRTTSQIKVAWKPPILTNGVLNGYQVTVKGPKVSHSSHQDTRENYYIVSGLLPGTEYKFEVHAITAQGRGDPATLHVFTVNLSYHAPPKPTLTVLGRHEIQVEWDLPKNPLNRINHYEVKANGEVVYNGLERLCVLRRLQPDTEYTVTVSAWTNEGRCESVPNKRRTNRNTSIPVGRRLPLYPYQKKSEIKSSDLQ